MLIDLSKILTHEGMQQNVEMIPEGDKFSCKLGEFFIRFLFRLKRKRT